MGCGSLAGGLTTWGGFGELSLVFLSLSFISFTTLFSTAGLLSEIVLSLTLSATSFEAGWDFTSVLLLVTTALFVTGVT